MTSLLHRYNTAKAARQRNHLGHDVGDPATMAVPSSPSKTERKIVIDTSTMETPAQPTQEQSTQEQAKKDQEPLLRTVSSDDTTMEEHRAPVQDVETQPDDVSRLTMGDVGPTLSYSMSFDSVGASTCCSETSKSSSKQAKDARREQQRHRLVALAHAASAEDKNCTTSCCTTGAIQYRRSAAARRLYLHISQCTLPECFVPGCLKSRKVWAHFVTCDCDDDDENENNQKECPVCCVVTPVEHRIELRQRHADFAETNNFQKQRRKKSRRRGVLSPSSSVGTGGGVRARSSPGRPPLSPTKSPRGGSGGKRQSLVMAEV